MQPPSLPAASCSTYFSQSHIFKFHGSTPSIHYRNPLPPASQTALVFFHKFCGILSLDTATVVVTAATAVAIAAVVTATVLLIRVTRTMQHTKNRKNQTNVVHANERLVYCCYLHTEFSNPILHDVAWRAFSHMHTHTHNSHCFSAFTPIFWPPTFPSTALRTQSPYMICSYSHSSSSNYYYCDYFALFSIFASEWLFHCFDCRFSCWSFIRSLLCKSAMSPVLSLSMYLCCFIFCIQHVWWVVVAIGVTIVLMMTIISPQKSAPPNNTLQFKLNRIERLLAKCVHEVDEATNVKIIEKL